MTREEFVKKWHKKGKVEKFCILFFSSVILPWMIGLVITTIMMEPLVENFVMIFYFFFYTVVAAFPFGLIGCMLEFLREDKEELEQSFLLMEYGKLSLHDQSIMPAEERAWWIKRLDKEQGKI